MTLSTNLYVLDPVDVPELFRFGQQQLTSYDDRKPPMQASEQQSSDRESWQGDGARLLGNQLGQGLPAILEIAYRPDAPLWTPEQAAAHDEDCEPECDGNHYRRACWADVDFDTAYGYRDAEGRGCGDLHALLVAAIGQYLDMRDIRWEWRNEYTSEVHGGEDRYARLIDLVSSGFEAAAWFRTSVLPAIAAHIALGGAE